MSKRSFIIFCFLFFTVSFGVAAMAALIPSIADYFGAPEEYVQRLTWLYMLPYGVFALLWAPLTRVIKIKSLLLFSTAGCFICTFLFSIAFTLKQIFIFGFLMGSFACSFAPLTLITIGKTAPASEKAKYIGIFFTISSFSTLIGVFLSGFLNWRIIYLIPAILGLTTFILTLFYLDDFDFRKERFSISYLDTLKDHKALGLFAVIMLASFIYHSIQQHLGVYLSTTYLLSQFVISSIFTISTLSAVVFEFSGGLWGARFGTVKVARAGFILMGIFSLGLILIEKYQLFPLLVILWGAGWALTHVGLSAYLTHFPDKILRDASSLNSSLRFGLGGLGSMSGGLIVSLFGFKFLFLLAAIAIFLLGFYLDKIIEPKESHG